MKNSLLINNNLRVNFWVDWMNIVNNFCNLLKTEQSTHTFILEEVWTNIKQNLEHISIFRSRVSTFISNKKLTLLDIWKIWKRILMSYTEISKHLRIYVSCTYQVFMASNLVLKKDILIIKYLLSP